MTNLEFFFTCDAAKEASLYIDSKFCRREKVSHNMLIQLNNRILILVKIDHVELSLILSTQEVLQGQFLLFLLCVIE